MPLGDAQATVDSVGPWVNAGVLGLLTMVLTWIFSKHLPAKDAQIEKLITDKDAIIKAVTADCKEMTSGVADKTEIVASKAEAAIRQINEEHRKTVEEMTEAHERTIKEVVKHCREEVRAEREVSERRHKESIDSLTRIHESTREGVHATKNLAHTMSLRTKLADAFQSTEVPAWTKSLDGTIMSWNVAAERVLGWKQGEVVGRRAESIIIPHDRRGEEQRILSTIASGGTVEPYETVRVAKNGRLVPMRVVASPIRDQAGQVVGCSAIGRVLDGD